MTTPIPPSLERFGDDLNRAAERELPTSSGSVFARVRQPRRLFAGGTLGLAGVTAALVVALGGSTAAPAFAITHEGNGSVLVHLNYGGNQNLPQVNARLIAMGTNEQITIYMATGAASVSGPVTCTAGPGAGQPNPPVKVLVGSNGTEVIAPGESGGNTAEGSFHLDHCTVAPTSDTGPGTGNTGA
ncbi:MAG TPA: hypothetical protein VG223_13405 [Solirubrobacteraceae bacterium]|jgi:hypothetical protein|nr:hypothetical protein [Solirubrobacteraceae bacterium]